MAGVPLPATGFPADRPLSEGLPQDLGIAPPVGARPGAALPMPQSQPGAEALIAPPAASGDDLFAQLGIPRTEIAKLASARGKATGASNAAIDALQQTQDERTALREQMAGMTPPDAPQLDEIPEAPQAPPPTDTLRVFGQFLPVLAILGGLGIKNNATAALNAASTAMQAAKDNDAAALKQAHEQFELELKEVLTKNERSQKIFSNASALFQTDMNSALAQLQALAGEEQNPKLQADLAAGNVKAIQEDFALRFGAWEKLTNAHFKMLEANAAKVKGVNLNPADASYLTKARDGGDAARLLRGMAQEFAGVMQNQKTGPVSGSPLNPFSYTDTETQVLRSLGSRMTTMMRPSGAGATSDFEAKLYAQGAPSADKTRAANEQIIKNIEKLTSIQEARQFYYEAYASQIGSLNGAEQAFQRSPEFAAFTTNASAPSNQGAGLPPGSYNWSPEGGVQVVR